MFLLFLVTQPCVAADSNTGFPSASDFCISTESIASVNSYSQANSTYMEAMTLADKVQRTEKLNASVDFINSYLVDNPDSVKGLVLASEIYRARGGRSYAVKYNERAKFTLKKYIIESNDIHSMLDYAILCSAGDDRYADSSAENKDFAQKQAKIIIQLCQMRLNDNVDENTKQNLRETLGIAYLILGDKKQCHEYLKMSSSPTLDVFEHTVLTGTWLWPLNNVENVDKEFLLYYLKLSD